MKQLKWTRSQAASAHKKYAGSALKVCPEGKAWIENRPPTFPNLTPPLASLLQGSGHFVWREAWQCEVLGESRAAPALAAAGQSQEGVHCVRTHRHQHAPSAGKTCCFTVIQQHRKYYRLQLNLMVMCVWTGPSGWNKGEDSVLLVLRVGSNFPQCQNREEGLHAR